MSNENTIIKVVVWRVLSIIFCTLAARIWFGDWNATMFGFFISICMTLMHYYYEKFWNTYIINYGE